MRQDVACIVRSQDLYMIYLLQTDPLLQPQLPYRQMGHFACASSVKYSIISSTVSANLHAQLCAQIVNHIGQAQALAPSLDGSVEFGLRAA